MIGLLKRWLSAWVMVILNLNLPLGSVECFGIAWSANQHMSGRKAYGCNFRDIAQWHASADDSVTPSRRDEEIVACRIVLSGDVQGGYYRSCVMNEVSIRSTRV